MYMYMYMYMAVTSFISLTFDNKCIIQGSPEEQEQ